MINFFIKTYGCQANVADSQAIANYLISLSCKQVKNEKDADIIIINTCAIREKAEQKVFSYLGQLAQLKKEKPYLKVGVIGCIASYRKKELRARFDHVRFVFGAKNELDDLKLYLADLVVKLEKLKKFALIKDDALSTNRISLAKKLNLALGGLKSEPQQLKQSFINIMTGCNNYCSYCIVPFTRGPEKSYSSKIILQQVKHDLKNGSKEIILLGQNVNSYKDPDTGLGFEFLLEEIAQIDGDFWVRFVSPHPKDMTKDLLYVMAKHKNKLCGFIHHPLQSGSNKVLKAMNRTYSVEKYLEQINWIREILPHATISTDIIVGFPGETEQDYLETRKVLEIVSFDNVFSFIYSPRKYTKAALLKDDCPEDVKLERLKALQKRQIEICKDRNSLNLNKTLKCLVEKRLTNGKLLARTSGNLRVLFEGDDENIGNFVDIKIYKSAATNVFGSLE